MAPGCPGRAIWEGGGRSGLPSTAAAHADPPLSLQALCPLLPSPLGGRTVPSQAREKARKDVQTGKVGAGGDVLCLRFPVFSQETSPEVTVSTLQWQVPHQEGGRSVFIRASVLFLPPPGTQGHSALRDKRSPSSPQGQKSKFMPNKEPGL